MIVSIIVAMDRNGLIGRDSGLPWRLPADLKHFKSITMGKPLLMGRKTHDSIGRPLPGRRNIVMTRDPDYQAAGCTVVHSLDEALAEVAGADEVMVIGGANLYRQTLPEADRIYLTRIDHEFEGDTRFPAWADEQWKEVDRTDFEPDENNPYRYSFMVLERRSSGMPASVQ